MTNDLIADLLTRLRNATERGLSEVVMPSSKMVVSVLEILKAEKFIDNFEVEEKKPQNSVKITLKNIAGIKGVNYLEKVSKPGLRIYLGYREIPKVQNGLGIAIVSTSKGLMTGEQARKERVGGELIAKIW